LAVAEKIDRPYPGKMLRLASRTPNIVEAALNGRLPEIISLPRLLAPLPTSWGLSNAPRCSPST